MRSIICFFIIVGFVTCHYKINYGCRMYNNRVINIIDIDIYGNYSFDEALNCSNALLEKLGYHLGPSIQWDHAKVLTSGDCLYHNHSMFEQQCIDQIRIVQNPNIIIGFWDIITVFGNMFAGLFK
jgi:hypothetical protein